MPTQSHKFVVEEVFAWANISYDDRLAKSMILIGPTGSGKTHLAVSAIKEMITKDLVSARYCSFRKLVEDLRGFEPLQNYMDGIDMLLLDDVGDAKANDLQKERVKLILTHRMESMKPMILTSNLRFPESWISAGIIDDRLASRLFQRCKVVDVQLPDWRMKKDPSLDPEKLPYKDA